MTKARAVWMLMTLLAVVLSGGCWNGDGAATEKTIEARAAQRWQYLIAKQADKAYDYLTPGFRKATPRDRYAASMGGRPIKWSSVKVTGKECQEDTCDVLLALDYEVLLAGAGARPIKSLAPLREKWVKVDGQWYFLPGK